MSDENTCDTPNFKLMRQIDCKRRQSIIIGDEIEITVLSISDEQVQIGIQAPREIAVVRTEIYVAAAADCAKSIKT